MDKKLDTAVSFILAFLLVGLLFFSIPMFETSLASSGAANEISIIPNFSSSQCNIQGTQLTVANQPYHTGDITIPTGQSYLVANMNFNMIGNFIINGGVLIIRNATIEGPYSNWILENGGCMEFTDSNYFSEGGTIYIGGQNPTNTPDSSKFFVNQGTIMPRVMVTGRDELVNATYSIFEQGVFMSNSLTYYPQESSSTKVFLTSSIIPTLALAFSGPSQPIQISDLEPGVIRQWDFQRNLSLPQIPYDVSLNNATLIPNSAGPGDILGGGWGLYLSPGGPSGNLWPNLKISNSQIGYLGLFGFSDQTQHINNIGQSAPVSQTILGTVNIENTTVDGLTEIYCNSCNLEFDNVEGLALTIQGSSSISFINSSVTDYFNPVDCSNCNFTFKGNSSLGNSRSYDFTKLPYYKLLPNASYWSQYSGSGYVVNSTLTIAGNMSVNFLGPDGAHPATYLTWNNSTATRLYQLIVEDQQGRLLPKFTVSISSSTGDFIQNLTSNSDGSIDLPTTYTASNYTHSEELSAMSNTLRATATVSLLSNTPIILQLKQPGATTTTATGSLNSGAGQSQITVGSQTTSGSNGNNGNTSTASSSSNGPNYTAIEVVVALVGLFSLGSLAVKRNK